MAQAGYQRRGTWKTSCGRLRTYYVQTSSGGGSWTTAASADTEAQLAAAIERVRARRPERAIRVVAFVNGERIEGDRQEPVTATTARAA